MLSVSSIVTVEEQKRSEAEKQSCVCVGLWFINSSSLITCQSIGLSIKQSEKDCDFVFL